MELNKIYHGDSLEILKSLPSDSVDCCITSPPYYALRDYGIEGQIGLEETPEEYIEKLVSVFHEVKRVLVGEGTLWLNIGDSYWGSGSRGFDFTNKFSAASKVQQGSKETHDLHNIPKLTGEVNGYKTKDLIGIPWMLAFALRADGWYLRQDIIWAKKNCMPESVRDRCVKSHEYIFLMSKNPKYYFDYKAIQTPASDVSKKRAQYGLKTNQPEGMVEHFDTEKMGDKFVPDMANARDVWDEGRYKNLQYDGQRNHTMHERRAEGFKDIEYTMANKRDVWRVSCSSYKEAHFATFPEELIRPCIKAGCPKGGIVLDPFFGSGTTGAVAIQEGCNYIGIELNGDYIKLAEDRLSEQQIRLV